MNKKGRVVAENQTMTMIKHRWEVLTALVARPGAVLCRPGGVLRVGAHALAILGAVRDGVYTASCRHSTTHALQVYRVCTASCRHSTINTCTSSLQCLPSQYNTCTSSLQCLHSFLWPQYNTCTSSLQCLHSFLWLQCNTCASSLQCLHRFMLRAIQHTHSGVFILAFT